MANPARSSAIRRIRAFIAIYLGFVVALLGARALRAETIDETVVREVMFNLASVISTTGFASTDYSAWGPAAWTLIFCAMMICGCSGSTTGGPKVFRYQLLIGTISGEVRRLHSPNVVFTPHYQGQAVSDDVLDSVMAFFMLFFLTLGTGAVVLVLLGLDPVTAITGVATCLSNVGPGLGDIIGPAGNFASLDPGEMGVVVPDAGGAARVADGLRAVHRGVLARLTSCRTAAGPPVSRPGPRRSTRRAGRGGSRWRPRGRPLRGRTGRNRSRRNPTAGRGGSPAGRRAPRGCR